MSGAGEDDPQLTAVANAILALDPHGDRTAQVLRETFDQLYDGQRTGRFCWDQLLKTEKTHCGTLVEINLQREFTPQFGDGAVLDYCINGVEVDCKYSYKLGGWMIPPEAVGHICLVVTAIDDADPKWTMGVVRVASERLKTSQNRDAKSQLNETGMQAIQWLFKDSPLLPNILLQLDRGAVDGIMGLPSGQKRINELFRIAQGKLVSRATVATVARQYDYMKRVREKGGARTALRSEGIIILGQYKAHSAIAEALGLPLPKHGSFVSARVVPADSQCPNRAEIQHRFWRLAAAGDPVVEAPNLPKTTGGKN